MPSKKRKYNARFPAGRIKKIMQTDEEVGKVAQAVPIIISRTLELFVESLLGKAVQVTMGRNAKTLSPSHVKQCILAESRFDFLRDLVKNIPDVSAAEEKEMMSAESSPNSTRYTEMTVPPRKIAREDSNSSSSCEVRVPQTREHLKRALSAETDHKLKIETVTSTIVSNDTAIDLTKKKEDTVERPVRTANFYQETLVDPITVQHRSVIRVNPTYGSPQPSTSTYTKPLESPRIDVPKPEKLFYLDLKQNNNLIKAIPRTPGTPVTPVTPGAPVTPITPILNIDFTKNLGKPEIKVLDKSVANVIGVGSEKGPKLQRQNSKASKPDFKKEKVQSPVDIDHINSGNLQIDEDYDT